MADYTNHFDITKLEGTDPAGHTSINNCLDSIDSVLYSKVCVPGMVILWDANDGDPADAGWTDVTATLIAAGAPSLTGYLYIKKVS